MPLSILQCQHYQREKFNHFQKAKSVPRDRSYQYLLQQPLQPIIVQKVKNANDQSVVKKVIKMPGYMRATNRKRQEETMAQAFTDKMDSTQQFRTKSDIKDIKINKHLADLEEFNIRLSSSISSPRLNAILSAEKRKK